RIPRRRPSFLVVFGVALRPDTGRDDQQFVAGKPFDLLRLLAGCNDSVAAGIQCLLCAEENELLNGVLTVAHFGNIMGIHTCQDRNREQLQISSSTSLNGAPDERTRPMHGQKRYPKLGGTRNGLA